MRVFNTITLWSVLVLSLFSSFSKAQDSAKKEQKPPQTRNTVGIHYQFSQGNLSIFIDQKTLLKTIPKLQKKGLIDPNLSRTELSFYQPLLAATASIPYVTELIKTIYSTQHNVDQIYVSTYILSPDLYGNPGKEYCYSFDFNRAIYQRINWEKFQVENIKRIAPNFRTSEACQNLIDLNPVSF